MGASNAMLAYQLYAGRVPPLSMQLLAYMALVSRDADDRPWYGQGHEALAVFAMGRDAPISDADLRAVRRAVEPLLSIGAIESDRRASVRREGPKTVRYRLRLVAGLSGDIDAPPVDNPSPGHSGDDSRRTESAVDVGRFVDSRRTEFDRDVGRNPSYRGTKGGTKRSEKEENNHPPTATHPRPQAGAEKTRNIDVDQPNPGAAPPPGCPAPPSGPAPTPSAQPGRSWWSAARSPPVHPTPTT